jgi:hypothetical protein
MDPVPSRPYKFSFWHQPVGPGRIDRGNSFLSSTCRARNDSWKLFLPGPTISFFLHQPVGPGRIDRGNSFQALQVFILSPCCRATLGFMEAIPSRPYKFSFWHQPVGPGRIDGGSSFSALQVLFSSKNSRLDPPLNGSVVGQGITLQINNANSNS